MWLLTVINWSAEVEYVMRKTRDVRERNEAWVCRGTLNEGLRLLKGYSDALRRRYGPTHLKEWGSVTEFRLLSVARLPDDTDVAALYELGVEEITDESIASVPTN